MAGKITDGKIRFPDNLRRCPVCGSRKYNLAKDNLTEHLVKEHGWVEKGIVVRQPNGDWGVPVFTMGEK